MAEKDYGKFRVVYLDEHRAKRKRKNKAKRKQMRRFKLINSATIPIKIEKEMLK